VSEETGPGTDPLGYLGHWCIATQAWMSFPTGGLKGHTDPVARPHPAAVVRGPSETPPDPTTCTRPGCIGHRLPSGPGEAMGDGMRIP